MISQPETAAQANAALPDLSYETELMIRKQKQLSALMLLCQIGVEGLNR